MPDITSANNFEDIDLQRPFQGLQAFTEKNKSQFGGRDVEINELFLLTRNNLLTIVFGKSGIGKTSVLQAGLMPELQKKSFFPIYFRIDYSGTKSPLVQLKDFIYEKLKSSDPTISEFGNKTLWEYFHDIKLSDGKVIPVLILDQFEETFTIGIDTGGVVAELITELSDLAENRIPFSVYDDYQKRDELIPSRYERQPYRIIIGLREDYLAQLESLKKQLPSIQKSRCRILQMTVLQAMQSVLKSAGNLIDKPITKEIIKKLPGITERDFDELADNSDQVKRLLIEPFLLSLICFQINEKRIERGLEKFTPELVSAFQIKDVTISFYNDALKNCTENVRIGIEDSLLTESGYRRLALLEELQSKYKIDDAAIETLINKRLIRQEERDGVDYVELIHDVLVGVIKEKRENRKKDQFEKERQEAIQKTIEANRLKFKKIRNRSVFAGTIVLIVFALISYYAYTKAAEATRLKNIELAQKLLVVSNSAAKTYGDYPAAALISRTAYLIYKENQGNDFHTFYLDMYNKLRDCDKLNAMEGLPSSFVFSTADNSPIKSIAFIDGYVYSGYEDGKILKTNWKDSTVKPEIFCDFKECVTGISVSKDKNHLAVIGNFPFVQVFDLRKKNNEQDTLKIAVVKNPKAVLFTDDGSLLMLTESALTEWNNNNGNPYLKWKERKQFNYEGGNFISSNAFTQDQKINWNADSLLIPGVKFKCIAVFKDMIAIGIDSGLVLIKKDSIIKIKSPGIGEAHCIQFDANGNYLYIGNEKGELCKVKATAIDSNIEITQNHSLLIYTIACSNDGKFIATASDDGSVGIYDANNDEEWKYATPLILSFPKPCEGKDAPIPNSVVFSDDNKYLLAGYDDGTIYKWPVSSDILSELICDKINLKLDIVWTKYVDKKMPPIELNNYNCNQIIKK